MTRSIARCAITLALIFAAAGVHAGTARVLTVQSNGVIGSTTVPTPVQVTFEGDGSTTGIQLRVLYDTATFDAVRAPGVGNCSVNDTTGVIIVAYLNPSQLPLPTAATSYCDVTFTIATNVTPPASFVLDASNNTSGDGCFDASANPVTPCDVIDGAIDVIQATVPTITYSPTYDADATPDATAELTTVAGALGSTQPASIFPTANGGFTGSSVTLSCQASAAFTIVAGGNQVVSTGTAATPITVQATLGAAAQTGTVTCTETDTPGGMQRTRLWDLVAPAGEPTPEFGSTPPASGTIAITGAAGQSGNGSLVIQNLGAGPLQVACQLSGSAAITQGTLPTPIPAGGTSTLSLACTVPTTPVTATLACQTNDADEPFASYTVTCGPSATAAIPATSRELLPLMMVLLALLALPHLMRRTS